MNCNEGYEDHVEPAGFFPAGKNLSPEKNRTRNYPSKSQKWQSIWK